MKKNIFVFDIETIPDIDSARNLLKLPDDSEEDVYKKIAAYHDADKKPEEVFLKPIFHKVVAISYAHIEIDGYNKIDSLSLKAVRSGGNIDSSEEDLIRNFFRYVEEKEPMLVSFNGRAFDMPVLKFRAIKYGITTNMYNLGDKWNSYSQRYSADWHCDLHEVLTDYYASGRLKLDEACNVFGYPGKVDVDGSTVYGMYKDGKLKEIRDYCETDVLNTYLVYLSYALHYGKINKSLYDSAISEVIQLLEDGQEQEHYKKFLEAWK